MYVGQNHGILKSALKERGHCAVEKKGIKIAAQNRKAYHDYFVEDRLEAGIELRGTEVKSIRAGTLNLKDSYCVVKNGEAMVYSMHISPYDKGEIEDFSIIISCANQVPPIIILFKQIRMKTDFSSFLIRESVILQFNDNLV